MARCRNPLGGVYAERSHAARRVTNRERGRRRLAASRTGSFDEHKAKADDQLPPSMPVRDSTAAVRRRVRVPCGALDSPTPPSSPKWTELQPQGSKMLSLAVHVRLEEQRASLELGRRAGGRRTRTTQDVDG